MGPRSRLERQNPLFVTRPFGTLYRVAVILGRILHCKRQPTLRRLVVRLVKTHSLLRNAIEHDLHFRGQVYPVQPERVELHLHFREQRPLLYIISDRLRQSHKIEPAGAVRWREL